MRQEFKTTITSKQRKLLQCCNGVFSHDVTAAILVSQNNEMTAMLVSQTNPVGVELFSYVTELSFVPINLNSCWPR